MPMLRVRLPLCMCVVSLSRVCSFFYCFLFWGMLASALIAIDLWRIDFIALIQV